jgi:acyl-coenzyme A thioesterase PaaI-like protein
MQETAVAFRVAPERRDAQLREFNARQEILWFGFRGAFVQPASAMITLDKLDAGTLGGGGTAALNGGVIAAGFDAAFVLAGLGQYEVDVVVTLELSVQFLHLALASPSLAFEAQVVRSARNFSFVRGFLSNRAEPASPHLAIASGMVAPSK